MEIINGVIGNLIAALIGALFGYLAKTGWDKYKKVRRSKTIIDFFKVTQSHTLIIHSAIFDETRQAYSYAYCDSKVARIITSLFESVGQKEGEEFTIVPDVDLLLADGTIDPTIMNKNLVLICSPKRNRIAKHILSKSPKLRYQMEVDETKGEIVLFDELRQTLLISSQDLQISDKQLHKPILDGYDYGLIASMPNPFNLSRNIVLLAGIHGSGTLGAGMFVGDENSLSELCHRRKNGVIQELIIAKYKGGAEKVYDTNLA